MPKSVRRVTFQRQPTLTYTADMPGFVSQSNADLLAAANLPNGVNSLGELLAGSPAAAGNINQGTWAVSGTPYLAEPYGVFAPNTVYQIGQVVAPTNVTPGSLLYVVTARTGDFRTGATEPNWPTAVGNTVASGNVTFRAFLKHTLPTNFANSMTTTLGQRIRPSANSLKEFIVTTAGTAAASAPAWTSNDTVGASITSNTTTFICIAGCTVYGTQTLYGLGDVIKPSAGSTEEWVCTAAGKTDDSAAPTGAVAASVTRGAATFQRVV
jgi:hypothetical protein